MNLKIPVWLVITILVVLLGGISFATKNVYDKYPDVNIARDPRVAELKIKTNNDTGLNYKKPKLLVEKRTSESTDKMTLYHIGNLISPDRTKKLYLEKEYNEAVSLYIRQAIKIENFFDKSIVVFDEKKFSIEQAVNRYTGSGCRMIDGFYICCNSEKNFNEFEPEGWIGNGLIWFSRQLDNFQCKNVLKKGKIFRIDGTDFFDNKNKNALTYAYGNYPENYWYLENICTNDNTTYFFLLNKSFRDGYSIVRFNVQNETFSNQMVEKQNLSGEDRNNLTNIMSRCDYIGNPDLWGPFFEPKSSPFKK